MEHLSVAHSGHPNQSVTGWGASLVLHACLALVALGLMPKMAVMVEKEPFKWDVALVEPPREVVRQEDPAPAPAPVPQVQPPAPTPEKPRPQPVRAVEPPPQPVQRQVETRVLPQAVQRDAQPVVETVRPQEQIQPKQEVVQVQAKPIEPQEIHKTEPVMQAAPTEVQREVASVVEQQIMDAAPATAQTYQAQSVVSAPAVVETVPEPVMTASAPVVHTAPAVEAVEAPPTPAHSSPVAEPVTAAASETPSAPPAPVEAVVVPTAPVAAAVAEPDPATLQEHQVVAQAAVARPAAKADYGWLAESLHRRIIELRHYPSTARLNGWEGKVVLKVSIRHDGQLKDVEVVKSSGYESLDQAAMEAVRRACPLHMKHELTAPMVVLHLPVSYSLNR
ncbi:MAG: TonB family protein [Nitrospira sp.]|nr:TonB family protein [Nitrospira sp.]MCC7472123.1 TonB family protein [Candidatus Nomurabacteria bacterium]